MNKEDTAQQIEQLTKELQELRERMDRSEAIADEENAMSELSFGGCLKVIVFGVVIWVLLLALGIL